MMKHTGKTLSEERRQLLWQLWHEGKTLQEIAQRLDTKRPSVFIYLQKRDGITLGFFGGAFVGFLKIT